MTVSLVTMMRFVAWNENELHSRLQAELPVLYFLNELRFGGRGEEGTKAMSSRMKPADGRLGQYPKTPEAHPPPEHESGHGSLVGLQSSWPRVDSSYCHGQETARQRESYGQLGTGY